MARAARSHGIDRLGLLGTSEGRFTLFWARPSPGEQAQQRSMVGAPASKFGNRLPFCRWRRKPGIGFSAHRRWIALSGR
jgi:hypothetical protein